MTTAFIAGAHESSCEMPPVASRLSNIAASRLIIVRGWHTAMVCVGRWKNAYFGMMCSTVYNSIL